MNFYCWTFNDELYMLNFLLPCISSSTRVTPRSQTLIDNIIDNKHRGWNNLRKHYDHYLRPLCIVYTLQKQNKITKKQKDCQVCQKL